VTELLLAGSAVAIAGAGIALRAYLRSRANPLEVERRRRAALAATGKLGDATLVDARDGVLIYSYDVHAVTYTASQDVSDIAERLPTDGDGIFGPVLVKYDPKNPANSIVLSEDWGGFRITPFKR
jgi:hypothetical protein